MRLPHNEGYDEAVCFLGLGFWLWVASHVVVLTSSLVLQFRGPGEHGKQP